MPTNQIRLTATAVAGSNQVPVNWHANASDGLGSGVVGYKLVYQWYYSTARSTPAPLARCNGPEDNTVLVAPGASTASAVAGTEGAVSNKDKLVFRLCAYDAAGWVATGVTFKLTVP
jgi:hypothetical protein